MGRGKGVWSAGLLVMTLTCCGSHAHALADSPGEILTKNRLKQVGPLYVLDAEAEAKKKLGEVRRLWRQLKSAKLQQESLGTLQDHQASIQNLNTQIGQIKAEINGVSQQINHLPRFRNRFASTYGQQQYAELTAYRNQVNFELGQQNNWLAQVKAHPPDPKMKQKLDDEVRARSDEYDQALRDLVQAISTAKEKYAHWPKTARSRRRWLPC